MTRNLKAMGLALLCVFVLGALGAQSASAAVSHTFTSDSKSGTILTGTTEPGTKEKFSLTGASFEFTDITYRGFQSGASDHISLLPFFTDSTCTTIGGFTATVHNNGCTYTFDSDTDVNTTHFAAGVEHANVSLACGHTGSITVTAAGCVMHFGTTHTNGVIVNHNLPGISYDVLAGHSGGKSGVKVTVTTRTIKARRQAPPARCSLLGLGSNGTHINGTYTGKTSITCYEGSSFPHTQTPTEGALVNCGLSTP